MKLREYETIYITKPDLSEQEQNAINERLAKAFKESGAYLLKRQVWGKRKLAYEIKKCSKGVYVSLKYLSGPELINELERLMKIMDGVIRFMTFRVADFVDVEKRLAEQKAEDEREAAEAAARQAEMERQQEQDEEGQDENTSDTEEERVADEEEGETDSGDDDSDGQSDNED